MESVIVNGIEIKPDESGQFTVFCPHCSKQLKIYKNQIKSFVLEGDRACFRLEKKKRFPCGHKSNKVDVITNKELKIIESSPTVNKTVELQPPYDIKDNNNLFFVSESAKDKSNVEGNIQKTPVVTDVSSKAENEKGWEPVKNMPDGPWKAELENKESGEKIKDKKVGKNIDIESRTSLISSGFSGRF